MERTVDIYTTLSDKGATYFRTNDFYLTHKGQKVHINDTDNQDPRSLCTVGLALAKTPIGGLGWSEGYLACKLRLTCEDGVVEGYEDEESLSYDVYAVEVLAGPVDIRKELRELPVRIAKSFLEALKAKGRDYLVLPEYEKMVGYGSAGLTPTLQNTEEWQQIRNVVVDKRYHYEDKAEEIVAVFMFELAKLVDYAAANHGGIVDEIYSLVKENNIVLDERGLETDLIDPKVIKEWKEWVNNLFYEALGE